MTLFMSQASLAQADNSCSVNVAISMPPIAVTDQVAFNVNNDIGTIRSTILSANKRLDSFKDLPCSSAEPYTISASQFSSEAGVLSGIIGQCSLKAGPLYLSAPSSNVSVVFPQDFNCGNFKR